MTITTTATKLVAASGSRMSGTPPPSQWGRRRDNRRYESHVATMATTVTATMTF